MSAVRYPASTVASRRAPYVLTLELAAATIDGPLIIAVTLARRGAADERPLRQELRLARAPALLKLSVRVDAFAPGDYAGAVCLRVDGHEDTWPLAFHRVCEPVAEPVPFAIYAVPLPADDLETCRARLREVRAAGLTMIIQHMSRDTFAPMIPALDEAARLGLAFMPSLTLPVRGIAVPEAERSRLSEDAPAAAAPHACFGSRWLRDLSGRRLRDELDMVRRHAGFRDRVYYGDDLFMAYHCDRGRVALSCYCDACREAFRAETGGEAPRTTERVRGVIAADHPWRRWNRFRCGSVYGGFVQALEDARAAAAPEVQIGLVHGFPFAPFAHVRAGIYSPLTMPLPAVSSYAYPYLRSPRQDLIVHYEMGRMGNRGKPVWMLGAINSNWTNYPAWQVYQNFWNMLAAGYDFIALFAWHDFVTAEERGITEHLAECKQALAECGRVQDWLFPMVGRWKPRPAPYAALYSFTTECFDLAPENRGHAHVEAVLALGRQALRRQVSLDVLCEEELRAEILDRYAAVALHDVRVLPVPLCQELAAYVRRGGTVFIDPDILADYDGTHDTVRVEGAIQVAPETMVAMMRDRRPPDVTVTSEHVTLRRLQAGDVEYVVLVNNVADQYWGCSFEYWDQRVQANYERMRYVRDLPVTTELRVSAAGQWLADLVSGDVVGPTEQPFRLTLPPSWGRAFVCLPCPTLRLAVAGPGVAEQGTHVSYTVEALTDDGQRLRGVFAAQVTVLDPAGHDSGRGGVLALEDGVAPLVLRLAVNDPTGMWTIAVTGGFPRRTSRHPLTVAPCAVQPQFVTCQA